jgi:hypothetical protein
MAADAMTVHMVPTFKAEFYRLQNSVIRRLNECSKDQWCATLESLDQTRDENSLFFSPLQPQLDSPS